MDQNLNLSYGMQLDVTGNVEHFRLILFYLKGLTQNMLQKMVIDIDP